MKSKVTAWVSAETLGELRAVVARFSEAPFCWRVSTFVEDAIRERLKEIQIIYGDTPADGGEVKKGRPPKTK